MKPSLFGVIPDSVAIYLLSFLSQSQVLKKYGDLITNPVTCDIPREISVQKLCKNFSKNLTTNLVRGNTMI